MARILELGQYVAPAYCGMLLAEQGHGVEKWCRSVPVRTGGLDAHGSLQWARDPILSLKSGGDLWEWINHGKRVVPASPAGHLFSGLHRFDAVVDNFRAGAWEGWDLDPAELADRHGVPWVSLRSEAPGRSFDVIAQARALGDVRDGDGNTAWAPFYLGDTAAGLFMAFKVLSMLQAGEAGHRVLGHASMLRKLVEGELQVERPEPERGNVAWDPELYAMNEKGAHVHFRDQLQFEPYRDREWMLEHLDHTDGRINV